MDRNLLKLLVCGVVAAGTIATFNWYLKKRNKKVLNFKIVGKVAGLFTYPVKSCQGISKDVAFCTSMGVMYDRNWVILDHGDRPITQRSHPMLARIKVTIDDSQTLTLSAEDKEDITLPIVTSNSSDAKKFIINLFDVVGEGVHVSEEADIWISEFLNRKGYRLFQSISSCKSRIVSTEKTFGEFAQPQDKVAFADLCPFLMLSEASLSELNNNLERKVQMKRFRPNIVLSGCQPFEEDEWKAVKIGDVEFRCLHRCGRCLLPTVDPETGIRDKDNEPLKTLRRIRFVPKEDDPRFGDSPIFGRNLACDKEGTICVGDLVYAC